MADLAPSQDPEVVDWLARRLCQNTLGEPVTDEDWRSDTVRSVWTPSAVAVLEALDSPDSPVRMTATRAPREQDVVDAFSRVSDHPAHTLNAVAEAIVKGAGWLPLSVRYGTAVLAVEAVQANP